MKRFFLFICAASMLLLVSCQETEEVSEKTRKETRVSSNIHLGQELEVVQNLRSFNDSLDSSGIRPNFNWEAFRKAMDITFCDLLGACEGAQAGAWIGGLAGPNGAVIGAAVGAPVVAAYRSYKAGKKESAFTRSDELKFRDCVAAYVRVKETISAYEEYGDITVSLALPSDFTSLQQTGILHNLILDYMMRGDLSSTPADSVLTDFEYSILTHPRLVKRFAADAERIYNVEMVDIQNASAKSIVNLLIEAVEAHTFSFGDLEYIINRYLFEICRSTELNPIDQTLLVNGICVLAHSADYWDIYNNPESVEI